MSRRGLSLVEVLVAAVLVGGPLVMTMGLGIEGTRTTARQLDRATAQLLVTDMAEWLATQERTPPQKLARACAEAVRARWLPAGALAPAQRLQQARRLDELLAGLKIQVELVPGQRTMVRVRLSLEPSPGLTARASVLLRVHRVAPRKAA